MRSAARRMRPARHIRFSARDDADASCLSSNFAHGDAICCRTTGRPISRTRSGPLWMITTHVRHVCPYGDLHASIASTLPLSAPSSTSARRRVQPERAPTPRFRSTDSWPRSVTMVASTPARNPRQISASRRRRAGGRGLRSSSGGQRAVGASATVTTNEAWLDGHAPQHAPRIVPQDLSGGCRDRRSGSD